MITSEDICPNNKSLGSRVLAVAVGYAPCLPSLNDESKQSALAILQGVAGEASRRGDKNVASQGVGSARVAYRTEDWFTAEDKAALRNICRLAGQRAANSYNPSGSFPEPDASLLRLWPEKESRL